MARCSFLRFPLAGPLLLIACGEATAPSSATHTTSEAVDTGDAVEWPTLDTSQACPVVDFSASGTYTTTRDVVYDVEDGDELLLDLYLPDTDGPRPGVVMVHGGGFTSGSRSYMDRAAEHYASAGFVVVNVEYRRVPSFALDDLVRDVVCSVQWTLAEADTLGLDPHCLGTLGESAGGYLVSMASLAGTDPTFSRGCEAGADVDVLPRWSVPYYGISDLPAFESAEGLGVLMPGLAELAGMSLEALSPTTYVGRDPAVGFFLPHGTADTVVPPSQSEVFFDVLSPSPHPVELRLLDGVDHGFMTGDGFWGEANRAVQADIEAFVLEMNAAR